MSLCVCLGGGGVTSAHESTEMFVSPPALLPQRMCMFNPSSDEHENTYASKLKAALEELGLFYTVELG